MTSMEVLVVRHTNGFEALSVPSASFVSRLADLAVTTALRDRHVDFVYERTLLLIFSTPFKVRLSASLRNCLRSGNLRGGWLFLFRLVFTVCGSGVGCVKESLH